MTAPTLAAQILSGLDGARYFSYTDIANVHNISADEVTRIIRNLVSADLRSLHEIEQSFTEAQRKQLHQLPKERK